MKPPLILVIVGVVLLAVCGLGTLITIALMATSNGKISGEEAGPFIGGGCCCSFFSLLIALGGGIWLLVASQKKQ
jgi:hypothetical protein